MIAVPPGRHDPPVQLQVHLTPGDDGDVVTGRLWLAGAVGIEERPDRLVASFATAERAHAARTALSDLDTTLRQPPTAAEIERWRAFAEPVWAASDTVVVPTWWDGPVPAAELTVSLDPGAAFGLGNHPTTAALVSRLRRRPAGTGAAAATGAVLDLGCGSGLLSIVAALGARPVVAVDIDPEARAAAAANVDLNGVAHRVTVAGGTIADAESAAPFDLILANVPVGVHEDIAATVGRIVSPSGKVWATGITGDQIDRVVAAHDRAASGLAPVETVDLDGEWWLVVLGRTGDQAGGGI